MMTHAYSSSYLSRASRAFGNMLHDAVLEYGMDGSNFLEQVIQSGIAGQFDADFSTRGEYPAWEYRKDSPLRSVMEEAFTALYGRSPAVEAIHAGLECGLFSEKLPGLDCVSIGPDLMEIHTPRERMSISSVQRVWAFLLEVLKRSK